MVVGKPRLERSGRSDASRKPISTSVGGNREISSRADRLVRPERTFRAIVCLFTVFVVEGAPSESTAGDPARNAPLDERVASQPGGLINPGGLRTGPGGLN